MRRCLFLVLVAVAGLNPPGVRAADPAFPDRQISLIAPYAVGSAADVSLRLVAAHMATDLGKPVVVENVTGASGLIGVERGRRSKPDGYTVLGLSDTVLIYLPLLLKNATFEPLKDFEHVSLVAEVEWVLVTNPKLPANRVADFVALAKNRSTPLTYASGGHGSPQHVAAEYLATKTGTRYEHIPYKGTTPALQAVLAGEVDFMLVSIAPAVPHLKEGRVRGLGTLGATRSELLPDTPTIREQGYADFEFTSWISLGTPAGVPKGTIETLARATAKALEDPSIRQKLLAAGMKPRSSSPAELTARLQADNGKLTELVRLIGIRPE